LAPPEILLLLQELNLIEVETAFGGYLRDSEGCCQHQDNEKGVKSFHDGLYCESE
jgi:hypothetical protein